jgi:hypothetical protein
VQPGRVNNLTKPSKPTEPPLSIRVDQPRF